MTDKDLEILLSVIYSKLESTLQHVDAWSGSAMETKEEDDETTLYHLRRLALELQGLAWHYGYSDLLTLLGDVKDRENRRAYRSEFLQAEFGYLYQYLPCFHPPFCTYN